MQSPPQIHVAEDVYLELPPEPILQALGTNYNAMVRTWTLRQYQLHLEHHQKMAHYYQQCIKRFEDLEVRYEREPEQTPIASVASGPIKLSDLAKQRPAYVPQAKPSVATGPSGNIKSFDGKTATTLSSSLAAKEVKLDKKPKPINVQVDMDQEERESLQEPEMQHFSRPQVARKNNKRSDIPKLEDDKSDDEVSTWQENPGAFSANGDKKESKIKSAFGGLKSSLFSNAKEEKASTTTTTNTTTSSSSYQSPPNPPSSPTTTGPAAQPMTYDPSRSYGTNNNSYGANNSYSSSNSSNTYLSSNNNTPYGTSAASGPPPIKGGPPPINTGSGQAPAFVAPLGSLGSGTSSGPPPLTIPPPPATPTHSPRQ